MLKSIVSGARINGNKTVEPTSVGRGSGGKGLGSGRSYQKALRPDKWERSSMEFSFLNRKRNSPYEDCIEFDK